MKRFDIEPLTESRRAKLERALFEKMDGEAPPARVTEPPRGFGVRPIVAFVLAGAAAAVLGAGGWELLRSRASPLQSHLETVESPTHIVVGESSLDVGAHTAVSFSGDDARGIVVVLEHGEVECEVAPRRGRPPFVVQSGDVSVRVIGTRFRVAHTGDSTVVSVVHGIVEVDEHEHATTIGAGESWPAATTAIVSPSTPATVPTQAAAPPVVVPTPVAASSPLPPLRAPNVASSSPPEPELSAREQYERALAEESTQPEAALATYQALATGSDAWAMNALFAESRLTLERGDRERAKTLLDEYIARFPSGPNAGDARALRARLQ